MSPVLALPAADIELMGHDSVLQNYCLSDVSALAISGGSSGSGSRLGSDVAMLPIGYSTHLNHSPDPNLRYQWHSGWEKKSDDDSSGGSTKGYTLPSALNANITKLLDADYSTLDIEYIATRDILEGDELTISYGIQWIEAWADYLARLLAFKAAKAKHDREGTPVDHNTPPKPLFRNFIGVTSGFFPEHWSGNEPTEDDLKAFETQQEEEHGDRLDRRAAINNDEL